MISSASSYPPSVSHSRVLFSNSALLNVLSGSSDGILILSVFFYFFYTYTFRKKEKKKQQSPPERSNIEPLTVLFLFRSGGNAED